MADQLEIRNEFSAVLLERVAYGQGFRLTVTSCLTGQQVSLDATVLEALVRMSQEQLAALVGVAIAADDRPSDSDASARAVRS